jgi:hypothetical protein
MTTESSKPDAREWSERELSVIRFALYRFAYQSRDLANAAAQDKKGAHAVAAFIADAEDAERISAGLAAAPVAQEPSVGARRWADRLDMLPNQDVESDDFRRYPPDQPAD